MARITLGEPEFADIAGNAATADVLFELGMMYCIGRGVAKDYVTAHKWFNLAAVAGYEDAAHCRADISDEMTAREIAEAQRRAREWIASTSRKAA
jgi:TPR repeat protein